MNMDSDDDNKKDHDDFHLRILTVLIPKLLILSFLGIVSIPLWPIVWFGSWVYGRPPIMVYGSQSWRYLKYVWTSTPPPPSYPSPLARKIWLSLSIVEHLMMSRFKGGAWLLDEVLYGQTLNDISITNPLFVISGGRSGSTQISRYLEEDEDLIAPNILMCLFPYLWLWKLVPTTIGRFITKQQVQEMIAKMMPKEAIERHEMDPFGADTFDGAFLSCHFNYMSPYLGPQIAQEEFSFCDFADHNRHLFEDDFCTLVHRLGQKTTIYNGYNDYGSSASSSSTEAKQPRFFLKGHFLLASPSLAKAYPDANFLTVVRDPLKRLQSGINFLRCNPADPFLGPVPWEYYTETLTETESRYCFIEMEWYTKEGQENRCVVSFEKFVHDDLQETMTKVYMECMNGKVLPNHIPKEHPPRNRTNYSVDRSLEDLGVNEQALRNRLKEYIDWIATQ